MRRVKLATVAPRANLYRGQACHGHPKCFFLNDAYSSVGGLEFAPFRINTAKSGPASTCPVSGRFRRSTMETVVTRSRRRHRTLQSVVLVGNRTNVKLHMQSFSFTIRSGEGLNPSALPRKRTWRKGCPSESHDQHGGWFGVELAGVPALFADHARVDGA